jgi:uncharacterized membrane protein SpoIIM required for sporulation
MFKLSDVLLSPKKARRHPLEIIFVGFFYATISLFLSFWIFPDYASLLMVFLTAISCIYIIQGILIVEENEEENTKSEQSMLTEHFKTLWFFLLLFLGFLFAFVFWTIVLPNTTGEIIFNLQAKSIMDIQSITGSAVSSENFSTILFNNFRVLFLSLLFALFYGAGAIFILAWNASIMGFVIGNLARNTLGLTALPLAFMKYFVHGIPEMLAYLAAALAGGILFTAVLRGDFKKDKLRRIITDTAIVTGISVLLLVIAALLEVYVSPYI